MKKVTTFLTLLALLLTFSLNAQVAINNDGTDANANSILHVKGNSSEALYIDATTSAVVVNSITPFVGDVFSSFATGTNWAINGYSVNAPAIFGSSSGSGPGVFGTSNGTGIGILGIVNNSGSFGMLAGNDNNDGTGLIAIGNNSSSFNYLVGGSGGAFTADTIGIVAWGTHTDYGTGVVGLGNNIGNSLTLTSGSGGAFIGDEIGVFGIAMTTTTEGWGGYFENDGAYAYVGGWIWVPGPPGPGAWERFKIIGNGSVSTIVKSTESELITMTCPEAPEVLFQDFGIGMLNNGKVHISIDPNFAKNINVDETHPLKVFITLEGDCNGVFVTNKTANGFDVIELKGGTSNVQFSWQIVATRANEEFILKNGTVRVSDNSQRFQPAPGPKELKVKETNKLEKIRIKEKNEN